MKKELLTQSEEVKAKVSTTPIRIKQVTARRLKALSKKLNRKSLGRQVISDDITQKPLELLTDKYLEEIKTSTYSNADKLELKYKNYCKKNGSISKDDFLKLIHERASFVSK